jgi:hypothetical protein
MASMDFSWTITHVCDRLVGSEAGALARANDWSIESRSSSLPMTVCFLLTGRNGAAAETK